MLAPVAPRIRPSGWWYLLPVAGLVLAFVLAVVMVRGGWQDAQDVAYDANLAAPGLDQTITIDEPGGYTVAYVGRIHLNSDDEKERFADDLAVEILPADGGEPLVLARYEGFRPIDSPTDDTQYVPVRTVRFEEAGDYLLRTRPQPGLDPERTLVVVTQSPWRTLADAVRGAAVLCAVGLFLALVGTMILARTRGRAKAAARAAAPQPAWWGPGPG